MTVPRRASHVFTRVPAPAWTVVLVLGALLSVVAWATASPPGSSPDEDFHLASIWCPSPLDSQCETRMSPQGWTEVEAPAKVVSSAVCHAFQPTVSGGCVNGLVDAAPQWTSRLDDGQYPGGFYWAMHMFVGPDVGDSVNAMRIFNGTLAVALFTAIAALSTGQARRLLAYGYLVVTVPMIIYLVASVNPSGWAITGVAGAWAGMHGFFTQPERGKRWALAGLTLLGTLMAATARADASAYLGVAAAAIVMLHLGTIRSQWRTVALPAVVAVLGVIGFLSASQAGALTGGMNLDSQNAVTDRGLLLNNIQALPDLLIGSQRDALNWFDTPVPAITSVPIILVAGAMLFRGLGVLNWGKGISLLGVVGVFVALPLLLLQLTGAPVGAYVQARYLTPLVPVIVAIAVWDPIHRRVARLTFGQTVLAYTAIVVGHTAVLRIQIRRYVTGLDMGGLNLNRDVEWWNSPIPPLQTWMVGSLGFAVLALALFVVLRQVHGDEDDTHAVAPPTVAVVV